MTDHLHHEVSPIKRALQAVARLQQKVDHLQREKRAPIAVVGMGCRFPGNVSGPDAFWAALTDGLDAVDTVPPSRWDAQALYDPDPDAPGRLYNTTGGFLADVDLFDAAFFGISPREAREMDPQQRLLLEVTWETCAHAGIAVDRLTGSKTGVFCGILGDDYAQIYGGHHQPAHIDAYYASGNTFSFAAGRIAYHLGVHGPVMAVETACASSLVAVHLACASLRTGECDLALAGGVNLVLSPTLSLYLCKAGAMSRSGRCRTFDAAADGIVRSDGCGVVALKRLDDARRDGDTVYAVVRGSAVNHGGASGGLTVPNGAAQRMLLADALKAAAMLPEEVGYVECHGTGTPLGDPIEVQALHEVFGARETPLMIGSLKTNFGHMDSAAGIAGLIKAVLVLHHGMVPPTLHLTEPSPKIDWAHMPLTVPTRCTPWQDPNRAAGVSSFGLSGVNAHVVLGQAPEPPETPPSDAVAAGPILLPLSAASPRALQELAGAWCALLQRGDAGDARALAGTAACRRAHHPYRLAAVGADGAALAAALSAFDAEERPANLHRGESFDTLEDGPVWVFSGQGTQWPGMGLDLMEAPVFRETLEACDRLIQARAGWSLLDTLAEPDSAHLARTDRAQPALFAVQVALAAHLRTYLPAPAAVVGHSIGEIAAAHTAGVLSLEDAVRVALLRGRLMHEAAGRGRMLAVGLGPEAAAPFMEGESRVDLAAVNDPDTVTLSGAEDALTRVAARLAEARVFHRFLPVDYAFHGYQMEPFLQAMADGLADLQPAPAQLPLWSTVHGGRAQADDYGPAYWPRNIRQTVLFAEAVSDLVGMGCDTFLELGPRAVLGRSVEAVLRAHGAEGAAVAAMHHDVDGPTGVHRALAALYCRGTAVAWSELYPHTRPLPLPAYPWQRVRYWADDRPAVVADPAGPALPAEPAAVAAPSAAPAAADPLLTALRDGRKDTVRDLLRTEVARILGLEDAGQVHLRRGFFDMGFDSMTAGDLRTRLSRKLQRELPNTLAFNYSSVDTLGAYLHSLFHDEAAAPSHAAARHAEARHAEPIAVVGLACRFPGRAGTPDAFWRLLHHGVDAVAPIPADRWDIERFYDPEGAPGKISTREGGFLETVDGFDAAFFRLSPLEAEGLDPQHRLLLELSWEALEEAGLPAADLMGSRTGVFVGINSADYGHLYDWRRRPEMVNAYWGLGNAFCGASGRLSYFLGLQGPSVAVDTACSSSLTALHQAVQSLRHGECDTALTGGVNLILSPMIHLSVTALHAVAPDCRCKTFDEAADGYVRGEGGAMLVLKPLADALADHDPIWGVVRHTRLNQDGAGAGLSVPNGLAQEALLTETLSLAGVDPADVGYHEAHGTGTPLGDPIEMQAVTAALGRNRRAGEPLMVGSVKTNIGHLEAASGVAGLVKVLLAFKHREVPPHLHLQRPSSKIDWHPDKVTVPVMPTPWPEVSGTRLASVSAFGFTGTNAYALLEQAPAREMPADDLPGPYVLTLSAHCARGLQARAADLRTYLADTRPAPADVCYTAAVRRTHLARRLAVVGDSRDDLIAGLDAFAAGQAPATLATGTVDGDGAPNLAFVFSGHGSQWEGMARGLLTHEPAFRAQLEACDQALKPLCGWSVTDMLLGRITADPAIRNQVVQTCIFAVQVGLGAVWRARGIVPRYVVGHSMGEVAAAHFAGMVTLEDAALLITERSRLLSRLTAMNGGMAAVGLSERDTRAAMAGFSRELAVAVCNSPQTTVVAGDLDALDELMEHLSARNIFCRKINVAGAGHCSHVDSLLPELREKLAAVTFLPPNLPYYSGAAGGRRDTAPDVDYWCRNMRDTVRFADAVAAMRADGADLFLEISPHPILTTPVEQCLAAAGHSGAAVGSMERDLPEQQALLTAMARLHCRGYGIDWRALYPEPRPCLSLPAYPWQRKTYRLAEPADDGPTRPDAAVGLLHDPFTAAHRPEETVWQVPVDTNRFPFLRDWRVGALPLLPFSLTLALQAACGDASRWVTLEDVSVWPLPVHAEAPRDLQVCRTTDTRGHDRLTVTAYYRDAAPRLRAPLAVAAADLVARDTAPRADGDLDAARQACRDERDPAGFAAGFNDALTAGPALPTPRTLRVGHNRVLAAFDLTRPEGYPAGLHPLLLDAVCRLAAYTEEAVADAIPLSLAACTLPVHMPETVWAYVTRTAPETYDLVLFDGDGAVVGTAHGLRTTPLPEALRAEAATADFGKDLYLPTWQRTPRRPTPDLAEAHGRTWLLVADAAGIAEATAARLTAAGAACTLWQPAAAVDDPAALDRDAAALAARIAEVGADHVFYAPPLDETDAPDAHLPVDGASWRAAQSRGTLGLHRLVRALQEAGHGDGPKIWIGARGLRPVDEAAQPRGMAHAALWRYARILSLEHPSYWGGTLDIGDFEGAQAAAILASELCGTEGEDHLAFRGGHRYVARLARAPWTPPVHDALAGPGHFLLSGGESGLIYALAEWLLDRGADRISIEAAPSSAPYPARGARLAALQARGAVQVLPAGDALFAALQDGDHPVTDIVHAPTAWTLSALRDLSAAQLETALYDGARHAWDLHRFAVRAEVARFVVVASAVSVMGSARFASSAVRDALLDELVHLRRAQGLPGVVVNFTPWGACDLLSDQERVMLEQGGIEPMPPARGLAMLDYLCRREAPQVMAAPIDWQVLKPTFETALPCPLLRDIAVVGAGPDKGAAALLDALQQARPEDRPALMLDLVAAATAAVFGFAGGDDLDVDTGFFQMGMNSVMSLQLKTRLAGLTGLTLPNTLAFDHPTPTALARFLLLRLFPDAEAVAPAAASALPEEAAFDDTDDTDDADLMAHFDDELASIDALLGAYDD